MNLLRALFTVSGFTLISRITGLVREILMAALFGASAQTDAYNVAFRIPNLLRRLFAEGAFAQAFVPILGEFKTRRGEAATHALIDHTASILFWVLLVVTGLGVVGAPAVVWLLASGLGKNGGSLGLAVVLTRIMFPYILLISLVAAAAGVLNTWNRFAVPAFTPVLLNVSVIGCALALRRFVDPPIVSMAIGVVLGGVLQLALQVPALARAGVVPHIGVNLRAAYADAGVRRVIRQMIPATLAVSIAQISLIINTNIATQLAVGSVSWITYADRLMEFPTALLGAALATILTPSLSRARAQGDDDQYGALLDWGFRLCFLFALPCALALWLIAEPITATLFHRGAFSSEDVVKTKEVVTAYGVGLVALILVKILAPGFYARQDIRTPVKIGIVVLVATQIMNVVFVPLIAHAGLALSISLGACLNAFLLFRGLRRLNVIRAQPGWPQFLVRLAIGLIVLSVFLWWSNRQFDWIALKSQPYVRVGSLALVVAGAALVYFATLFLAGLRFSDFRRRI